MPLDGVDRVFTASMVAFPIELLEWGGTFSEFWGMTVIHIYG